MVRTAETPAPSPPFRITQSSLSRHHKQLDLRIHGWRFIVASPLKAGRCRRHGGRSHRGGLCRTRRLFTRRHGLLDQSGGGLWISHDGGRIWAEAESLHGQSIRALVQAPSNPKMLFAGTLQGVFRSSDAGETWSQISPPGSREIHEVESLAVDPTNPDIVYAGHLASALEDHRRRQDLAQHQARPDRRLRRVLHHHRSRQTAHRICQRVQRNLQERERR